MGREIKVLFIARRDEPYLNASIYEQAFRISNILPKVDPQFITKLFLVRDEDCEDFTDFLWSRNLKWADIVVVVKHTLLPSFMKNYKEFIDICHDLNTKVISAPVDVTFDKLEDPFVNRDADFVFTVSKYQCNTIENVRRDSRTFNLGHASRTNFECHIPLRNPPKVLIWENPVHYYHLFPEYLRPPYLELENLLKSICKEYDVLFYPFLSYDMDYETWKKTCCEGDIAIECKALNHSHSEQQLRKPATKVINYLSLGIPTICDSLPAYCEIEKFAPSTPALLFADNLRQWEGNLKLLFTNSQFRKMLMDNGHKAVNYLTIENHCIKYANILKSLIMNIRK